MTDDLVASRVGQSNISSSAFGGSPSFRLQEYSLMLANKHINELLDTLQEDARTRPEPLGAAATAAAAAAYEAQYLRVKEEIQRKIDSLKGGSTGATALGDSLSAVVAAAVAGQIRTTETEQQEQRQAAAKLFHNHHQQHQQLQHNSRRESNTESNPAFFIPAGLTKPQQKRPINSNRSQSSQTAAKLKTALKASVSKERQSAATCTAGRSGAGSGDPSGDHHATKRAPDSGKEPRQQRGGSGGIAPPPPPSPQPPPPPLPAPQLQAKKTVRYLDTDENAKHCQPPTLNAKPTLASAPRKQRSHIATAGSARTAGLSAPSQPQPHRLTATETSAEVQRHQTCPRARNTYSSEDDEDQDDNEEDEEDPSTAPATYSDSVSQSSREIFTCSDLVTDSCDDEAPLVSCWHSASPHSTLSGPRHCCISSQTTIAIRLGSGGQPDASVTPPVSAGGLAAVGAGATIPQLARTSPAGHTRKPPADSSVTTATATNTDSSSSSSSTSDSSSRDSTAVDGTLSERLRHQSQFNLSAALWGSRQPQQQDQKRQSARSAAPPAAVSTMDQHRPQAAPAPKPAGLADNSSCATASNTNSSTGATWSQHQASNASAQPQTTPLLVMPRGAAAVEKLPANKQQPPATMSVPQSTAIKKPPGCKRRPQQRQLQHHHQSEQQQQQRLRRCKRYRMGGNSSASRARVTVCGTTCTNASTQTCTYLPCDSFAKPPRPASSSSSHRRQPRKLNCQSAYYMAAVCDPDLLAIGSETLSCCCCWHASRRRIRDTATSAVVLRHGEAFNSVTVGPLAACQVSATLVAASRLRSVELHLASQLPLESWSLDCQQQASLATHAAPTTSAVKSCAEPVMTLRHHRVDCRLHERLSATALLFATDDADDRRRGASALLTRLFYPEDLHLLPGASVSLTAKPVGDQSIKVETAAWSLVAPTTAATVAVARARVAAAAVRVTAAAAAPASGRWVRRGISADELLVDSWHDGSDDDDADSTSSSGDNDWYDDSDGDSLSDC